MLRELPILCLCLASCFAVASSMRPTDAAEPVKSKKALYIGIDGTRYDAMDVAKTPNLDQLKENGISSGECLILGDRYTKNDTVSGPGWSTILTGVWADKHGVQDNTFKGRKIDDFPCLFTLLKRQYPESKTASFVTWQPIEDYIIHDADKHQCWEEKSHDYVTFDQAAVDAGVKELANPELDCLFVYIGQVDVAGHAHGFHPTVKQYIEAIERADAHVGSLVKAMNAREAKDQEDWIVVVTSDHGGKGTGHGGGHKSPEILNSFLIVSGESAERGKFAEPVHLVDAPVTVLTHLGVKPEESWQLDGKPQGLK